MKTLNKAVARYNGIFTDGDKFKSTIEAQLRQHGAWDYVVHNLGATTCVNFNDFNRVNYGCLRLLVDTLRSLDAVPDGFVMMSSMGMMILFVLTFY